MGETHTRERGLLQRTKKQSLVRAKMIGGNEQAREDKQRPDDYRKRFCCIV